MSVQREILFFFFLMFICLCQVLIVACRISNCSIWNLGFPDGSAGKESACNMGELGSIPGLGRSPGEGKGFPLQYYGLGNSMDCIVHGVAKSWTRLSDFHFTSLEPNSLTRDRTWVSFIGSVESLPLFHQGSAPKKSSLNLKLDAKFSIVWMIHNLLEQSSVMDFRLFPIWGCFKQCY